MTDIRSTALRIATNNTHRKLAREVGFCLHEEHKDVLADSLIHRIERNAIENEQSANRLYRGREALTIDGYARSELLQAIARHERILQTLKDVAEATAPSSIVLQAAE